MACEHINFTKKSLLALESSSEGKRRYVYDSKESGLLLQITPTGRKSFQLYKSHLGKPIRVTIGTFPEITVEQARKKAREIKASLDRGENPNETLREKRRELTFANLFSEYMERHSKPRKKTWKEDRRYNEVHLQDLGKKRLSTITRRDIAAIHARIGKTRPTHANRVLTLISSVFGRAIEYGLWEGDNPCKGIRRFPEKKRDRFLNGEELARFFTALAEEQNIIARDFFIVALLTGARRSNVLSMRWSDINLDEATWKIQETKNGQPQMVPLTEQVVFLLRERRTGGPRSFFVFPGKGKTGHLVEPKKAWKRICQAADLQDVRIHDLRRTFGSWQAITGASLPIIGKSLNHQHQSTTAIYARLDIDPVRASVEKATNAMLEAAGQGSHAG